MKKVRIKCLPKAVYGMNVTGKINNADGSATNQGSFMYDDNGIPDVAVRRTLAPTDRENATLEAEVGETVITQLDKMNSGGIPEFYTVGGKRHSQGGTPLNLPPDSFIFSRDNSMKIKDSDILAQFGKGGGKSKKGYTPADLSKQYDINKYRAILADPTSDFHSINTAKKMIENYNLKLGALSMVQESIKGFDAGIPAIAMPYLDSVGIDPMSLLPQSQQPQEQPMPQAKWGGNTYFKKGGQVNTYADGGPIKSQKVPSLAELQKNGLAKWDMNAEGYNEADVQPGDYIKKADGKWYVATMEDISTIPYTGNVDPRLGDLGEAYGRLEERLLTNKDLRKAVYNKYKENLDKAKPRNNLSEADLKAARELDEDAVINNFLEAQKQIMAVQSKGPLKDETGAWDKDLNNYTNTISELGFQPLTPAQTAAFQGAYISMQNLADAEPKFREQLSDFVMSKDTRKGVADEPGGGTGRADISDIDGWFGNTTIGQSLLYAPKAKELRMKEAEWNEAKNDSNIKHIRNQYRDANTPFWTEDIINLAGATKNLFDIQRRPPWNAIPGTKLPDPTFLTPDQQIQNILGATGQGTLTIGAFGNPQAFTANFAGIHGNAMNQVANAIGNVQDKNVSIANQFALQRSQIMNHANERNSQLATNLHDKYAMLNENFSNAKRQAWDGVRRNLVNAWSNRGKTQNLNSMTDQYYIDPQTGFKHFYNPREIKPRDAADNSLYNLASDYRRTSPDMSWEAAAKFAADAKGVKSATAFTGVDPDEMGYGYPGGLPPGYYQQG
jgi:hypothetical protein